MPCEEDMFKWSKRNIEKACILASAGFSATVAAEVLGTSKSSILGRARRKEEFKFSASGVGVASSPVVFKGMVTKARLLVGPDPEHTPAEEKPKEEPSKISAVPKKTARAHLHRTNAKVDKPLTEGEKNLIFSSEGINDESVKFLDMERIHCRWIVAETDSHETIVCGKKRISGSSYCAHHSQISKAKPRKPSQENTNLVVVTSQMVSSHQRKSLLDIENSSS